VNCRICAAPLEHNFVDLGETALANSFLTKDQLDRPESLYPLRAYVCSQCFLVQLDEYAEPTEIFHDQYPYFSSYARSWVEHARQYVEMATERFGLGGHSFVVEVASNDGYLLQFFRDRGVPCLGIEPTVNTAAAAIEKGIPTLTEFFGREFGARLAAERRPADLVIGNNVLAHVPDRHDFVAGMATLLAPGGAITLEFPHLLRLVERRQFDTIYHEHYSYYSFSTARRLLAEHDLQLFDVEELPTHGGSLRIYAQHWGARPPSRRVEELLERERAAGMDGLPYYLGFQPQVEEIRRQFRDFVRQIRGARVAGFGAAAKGNTFLNYCGVGPETIAYVVDDTPAKQGKFLPQSRIPVVAEERIPEHRPDFVLILPWNLRREISQKLSYVREWGGKFVTCIPELEVW
jgi:SAM-dependent methyltransferase